MDRAGLVAHAYNLSIWEADAGELQQVKGQSVLHSEFPASLAYSMKLISKDKIKQNETKKAWKKCFPFHCTGSFPHMEPLTFSEVWLLGFWILLKQSWSVMWCVNVKSQEEAVAGVERCL